MATQTKIEFKSLPEPIQEWLSSERSTQQIITINERLGTVGSKSRIIPSLIYRLVIKELDPRDFINKVHEELGISLIQAKLVSEEIDQAILRPIRGQLKNAIDLDINLLYAWEPKQATPSIGEIAAEEPKKPFTTPTPRPTGDLPKNPWPQPTNFFPTTPAPTNKPPVSKPAFTPLEIKPSSPVKPATPATPKSIVTAPTPKLPSGSTQSPASNGPKIIPTMATNPVIANAIRAASTPQPLTPNTPAAPKPLESLPSQNTQKEKLSEPTSMAKPFMLHEERKDIKTTMESAPQTPRPSLTFKVPVSLAKPAPQKVTHKPINIAIEAPFEETKPQEQVGTTKPQQRRVVHYSDLRTPVDPFGDVNKK